MYTVIKYEEDLGFGHDVIGPFTTEEEAIAWAKTDWEKITAEGGWEVRSGSDYCYMNSIGLKKEWHIAKMMSPEEGEAWTNGSGRGYHDA